MASKWNRPMTKYKSAPAPAKPAPRKAAGRYMTEAGTVHNGAPSRTAGRAVLQCSGRTIRATSTTKPVTCKRCGG